MNVTHTKNSLPKVRAFHRYKNTLTNKNFERINAIPDFNGYPDAEHRGILFE